MVKSIYRYIIGRKKFLIYTSLRLITTVIALLINIFIVRKLSVYGYGTYSLAIMLVGFATTFGFSWSSSSILYYGSKEKAEEDSINKTFWSRNILLIISLIFITLFFIVFNHKINEYVGQSVAFNILIWIYIQVIVDFLNQYYLTVQKQIIASIMYLISKTMFLLCIILLPFKSSIDMINLNIITDAIMIIFILKINKRDISAPIFDKKYFKEILSFSLWQLFGFTGLFLLNFGDNLVIKYFLDTKSIGVYNSVYKLFSALASMSYLITNFYGAYIIENIKKNDSIKLKNFFYKERFIICGIALFLHVVIICFCKEIIIVIYGYRYIESVVVLQVLLVGSVIQYFLVFYIPFCNATKGYIQLQALHIVQATINILLDIILIKHLGILGAAIATVTASGIEGIILIIIFERKVKELT